MEQESATSASFKMARIWDLFSKKSFIRWGEQVGLGACRQVSDGGWALDGRQGRGAGHEDDNCDSTAETMDSGRY